MASERRVAPTRVYERSGAPPVSPHCYQVQFPAVILIGHVCGWEANEGWNPCHCTSVSGTYIERGWVPWVVWWTFVRGCLVGPGQSKTEHLDCECISNVWTGQVELCTIGVREKAHSLQHVVAYTLILWVMDVTLTSQDKEQQGYMWHSMEMEDTHW